MGTVGITDPSSIIDIVEDRFKLSSDYAASTWSIASGFLAAFDDVPVNFDWNPPDPISTDLPAGLTGLSPDVPEMEAINTITNTPIEFGYTIPTLEDYTISTPTIPDMNVALPNFLIPNAPTTQVPTFTAEAPGDANITIPTADDIPELPPLPTLTDVAIPDEPVFNDLSFDAIMPVADLTPPDVLFVWNEAEYQSDVFDALRDKIIDGIVNGGQGMLPEVEQAIYDRQMTRLDIDLADQDLLARTEFSSQGSRLPQGALIARLDNERIKAALRRDDFSRDIMIKSADMAYQYSTFIIEKGISLEHETMTLFNHVQQRSFEAAKVLVDFAIQEYAVRVQAYTARLEGYKTEAEIFKTRIQAEIAKAELYKYVIEGRKLSLEMQGLMVDLYGKQLDGIETMTKIYATKMDAAKVQAEIEALDVEKFKALIDAYTARVQGVTAEYNLYQAQIAGEAEKAKMYMYQVEGYKATVDAYKVRADVDINILRARIEQSQGEIAIFSALIDKYKAEVQAASDSAETQAKIEGLKVEVFDSKVKQFTAVVAALVDGFEAETGVEIANADVNVRYGEMLARIETAEAEITAELVKAKSMISSQLASAALTSVSAGANLGYHEADSDTASASDSTSFSTQHSYIHTA